MTAYNSKDNSVGCALVITVINFIKFFFMKIDLKSFFTSVLCLFFILACKKDNWKQETIKGCKNQFSFNYNSSAQEDDGSCKDMQGCLGYAGGLSNSGTTGNTLNNYYWDQKMLQEINIQSSFYSGIPATVFILYEPSVMYKNAYATPDGKILFGYYMFYYTVQFQGELPVAGILAHEWGHRTQFTMGWKDYYKPNHMELEADAFSGYYMALAKQYAWSNIQSYYQSIYAAGDYNFNSPTHHGTPEQRLKAAYLGVTTAINAMQTNTRYNYDQLHSIFFSSIKTNIAGRQIKEAFREVEYPKIKNEDRQKLFPSIR